MLRRRADDEGLDARDLGGNHVHDDAGRQRGEPTGHVQADPPHRDPALGDRAAGYHRDVDRLATLRFVDQPNAADRLGEGRPNGGIQRGQRLGEGGGRHSRDGHVDAIEAQRRVPYRRVTPYLDIADDRCDSANRGADVHLCPGQHLAEIGGLDGQVDAAQHGLSLRASRLTTPGAGHR